MEFILKLRASGLTVGEILQDYSHLAKEDIPDSLEYDATALKNKIIVELEAASA
ncbi:MAG: DUF433 domain-containing protein [Chloroflexi bacterium]|nr:DUF433 domain-containing protein [Chloroflexota bacterium]